MAMMREFIVLMMMTGLVLGHTQESGILSEEDFNTNMKHHFDKFVKVRHPREMSNLYWQESRDYIRTVFHQLGLEVENQCFNTSVTIENEDVQQFRGCNIIGISKGQSDPQNRLVIGADYDTTSTQVKMNPLKNNGVGVAMLLEVARAFEDSWRWRGFVRNYTTIFVAFDLNTKEHILGSPGHSGSYFFVNDWLVPKLQIERKALSGSIILDSISTYNTDPNSQILPSDFKTVFPDAYDRISESNQKGDFIAAVSSPEQDGVELLKQLSGHYRMDKKQRPYRLQELQATDLSFGGGPTLRDLNTQASYHFWSSKPSLPSVLITDTGDKRIPPPGEACEPECNYVFANEQRMDFLYSTYQALGHTLLDRQTDYVGLNSAPTVTVSFMTLMIVLLINRIMA